MLNPQLAILADFTSMFYVLRKHFPNEQFDYVYLKDLIRGHLINNELSAETADNPDPALFFSSFDQGNAGQRKFHEFIESRLGWVPVEISPRYAELCNPSLHDEPFKNIRFDTAIAYTMGALVATDSISHIVIISDSFALFEPMLDASERGISVTLVFFGRSIDPRYREQQQFAGKDGISFLDLDKHLGKLIYKGQINEERRSKFSNFF